MDAVIEPSWMPAGLLDRDRDQHLSGLRLFYFPFSRFKWGLNSNSINFIQKFFKVLALIKNLFKKLFILLFCGTRKK